MSISAKHVLTILAVDDVAMARDFYRAAFGWAEVVETPVYVELRDHDGQRLGLYDRDGFGKNTCQVPFRTPAGELAPTELYFHVEAIEDAVIRMKKAGARELSPLAPRPWGDDAAYFADPSGNVLVLARPSV